jgi:hypothetical protein
VISFAKNGSRLYQFVPAPALAFDFILPPVNLYPNHANYYLLTTDHHKKQLQAINPSTHYGV